MATRPGATQNPVPTPELGPVVSIRTTPALTRATTSASAGLAGPAGVNWLGLAAALDVSGSGAAGWVNEPNGGNVEGADTSAGVAAAVGKGAGVGEGECVTTGEVKAG